MKINVPKVLLGGLIFICVQRILSVISIICIKPNIPDSFEDNHKEAIQTALEAVILILTVIVIQKLN
jgi:hypothetical protein